MSDAFPDAQNFLGDDADEELVFDDPEIAAASTSPAPEPKAPKARRASRRASASVPDTANLVTEPPSPAEPVQQPSAAALPAETEEPAATAPAPFPPHRSDTAGSKPHPLLMAVVGLSLLTSMLSLGGLITVSRTLASADADRRQAAAEMDALERAPALLAHLESASARLDAATQRIAAAAPSGPAASIADIRHELDVLKVDLAQHQPDGIQALTGTTRDGFAEMVARIDRLSDTIERKGQSGPGAVSASLPASRAAYPKPIS